MQHRRGETRQLAGFVEAQQRQQTGVGDFARIGAVNPGDVAPDCDAADARQRADLRGRVVGTVTPQQNSFARVVAADKAGYHDTLVRMLRQQRLQQRPGFAFIHLRLRGALRTQEVARVQPAGVDVALAQHRRHQARRPHFSVSDHFGVYRVGNRAIQHRGEFFQIADKARYQRFSIFSRQQPGDQLAVITP